MGGADKTETVEHFSKRNRESWGKGNTSQPQIFDGRRVTSIGSMGPGQGWW